MRHAGWFIGLAFLLCCGGGTRNKPASGQSAAEPKGVPAPPAHIHVTLEFEDLASDPATTQITLVETNEMGANTRRNLGVFDGACKDVTPDVRRTDPEVFLAIHCQPFGQQRGALVHIVKRRASLFLLRAWLGRSKPTFDEFDQIGELPPYPIDVPLKTDYDAE